MGDMALRNCGASQQFDDPARCLVRPGAARARQVYNPAPEHGGEI